MIFVFLVYYSGPFIPAGCTGIVERHITGRAGRKGKNIYAGTWNISAE